MEKLNSFISVRRKGFLELDAAVFYPEIIKRIRDYYKSLDKEGKKQFAKDYRGFDPTKDSAVLFNAAKELAKLRAQQMVAGTDKEARRGGALVLSIQDSTKDPVSSYAVKNFFASEKDKEKFERERLKGARVKSLYNAVYGSAL